MKKEEFATQIAGTLGDFATANQYSVGSLKEQLKRKNRLIKTLEAKLATAEATARDQANTGIEQARAADQKEIEWLKSDLEQDTTGGPDQSITDKPTRRIDRAATGQIKLHRKPGNRYRDIPIPSHRNPKKSVGSSTRFTC
jgi:protein subunit release factor B